MKKVFITARDIEDMARRGEMRLPLVDNLVITDYARERARDLGVELVRGQTKDEGRKTIDKPSAPVATSATPAASPSSSVLHPSSDEELTRRVKAAVIARVGPGVDEALLDKIIPTIIRRVRSGG